MGADVIYDPSCIPHLIRVLAILLNHGKSLSYAQNGGLEVNAACNDHNVEFRGTSVSANKGSPRHSCQATNKRPVAYIASVIRNVETFRCFLALAEDAKLSVTDITGQIKRLDLLPYMQSYTQADVRLFSVSV